MKNKFNFEELHNEAELYYRELIGTQGKAIHIEGSGSLMMQNITIIREKDVQIELASPDSGW